MKLHDKSRNNIMIMNIKGTSSFIPHRPSKPILKDPHLPLEAAVRQVADSLTADRQDQSRKEEVRRSGLTAKDLTQKGEVNIPYGWRKGIERNKAKGDFIYP